jgi:hypothetical protein
VDDSPETADRPWLSTDRRPPGVSDATVEATGKAGEALEWLERARGRLYDFHQMMGRADLLFGEAADLLAEAGHDELAELVRTDVVGRNVIEGRWTFQIIEEFDATYYDPCRDTARRVEDELVGGARHVYESEMKEARRTHGRRHHEQRPAPGA